MEIEIPEKVLKDFFPSEALRRGFIDSVNKNKKGVDLTKVDQFNRWPKNFMKKEPKKGVYVLFPLGKESKARFVMRLDPQNPNKLVFSSVAWEHDSQYSVKLFKAEKEYLAAQQAAKKAVQQGSRMPLSAGLTAKINEKVAQKTGAKLGTKAALKVGVKKVPGIGLVLGTVFAGMSAVKGDWQGAGMEFCSGLASCVPGWGTAASFAIDAALIAREAQKGH